MITVRFSGLIDFQALNCPVLCEEDIDLCQGPHHVRRPDGTDTADAKAGFMGKFAGIDDNVAGAQEIVEGLELEPLDCRYAKGHDDRRLQS